MSGAATAALLLYGLGLLLFYFIIKVAVRNGVREANAELVRMVRDIQGYLEKQNKNVPNQQ